EAAVLPLVDLALAAGVSLDVLVRSLFFLRAALGLHLAGVLKLLSMGNRNKDGRDQKSDN
ncbi:MAG: hypothetical protein ACKVH8_21415, partial [Pirellulales bacterium]